MSLIRMRWLSGRFQNRILNPCMPSRSNCSTASSAAFNTSSGCSSSIWASSTSKEDSSLKSTMINFLSCLSCSAISALYLVSKNSPKRFICSVASMVVGRMQLLLNPACMNTVQCRKKKQKLSLDLLQVRYQHIQGPMHFFFAFCSCTYNLPITEKEEGGLCFLQLIYQTRKLLWLIF